MLQYILSCYQNYVGNIASNWLFFSCNHAIIYQEIAWCHALYQVLITLKLLLVFKVELCLPREETNELGFHNKRKLKT